MLRGRTSVFDTLSKKGATELNILRDDATIALEKLDAIRLTLNDVQRRICEVPLPEEMLNKNGNIWRIVDDAVTATNLVYSELEEVWEYDEFTLLPSLTADVVTCPICGTQIKICATEYASVYAECPSCGIRGPRAACLDSEKAVSLFKSCWKGEDKC